VTPGLNVVVAAREQLAADIVAIDLVRAVGGPLPPFGAGSHIEIQVDAQIVRPYSLCNDPRERNRYRIGVLKEPRSRGASRAICEDWKVGDRIRVSEPRNLFPVDESATRSILIGGGIGVTPLLSMMHRLREIGGAFELHYCVRSADRAAFLRDIQESSFRDRTSVHLSSVRRFDFARDVGRFCEGDHLYICGPQKFIHLQMDQAKPLDWSVASIHVEYFDADADIAGAGFTVELADGARIEIGEGMSIASVLLDAGYDVEVFCEKGVCGSCVTGVLAGTPDHRDHYLTDEEKARNDCMALCCSRSKSPLIKIDL
jgi:vanillate O-demethylase ferredoxin subunit